MTIRAIVNLTAFQIGWFAAVLGAGRGMPWLGVVVVPLVCVRRSLTERARGLGPLMTFFERGNWPGRRGEVILDVAGMTQRGRVWLPCNYRGRQLITTSGKLFTMAPQLLSEAYQRMPSSSR